MVNRGLMSQASPNKLREFLSSSFSLFHGFHTFICTRTASKNTQKKSNTHRQVSTARTTAQHPKGFIAPKLLTRGRYSTKVCDGKAPPRGSTSYLFIYHFSRKSYPFCIPSIDKWYPFHINIPCLELCTPFNCCKCTF